MREARRNRRAWAHRTASVRRLRTAPAHGVTSRRTAPPEFGGGARRSALASGRPLPEISPRGEQYPRGAVSSRCPTRPPASGLPGARSLGPCARSATATTAPLVASMGRAPCSPTGMWLVAVVWQVIELGGGPSELSVVAAATSTGMLLSPCWWPGWPPTGCPGGHCSSRSRRPGSPAAGTAGALACLGPPAALAPGGRLPFVLGCAEASSSTPPTPPMLPSLLPPDELLAANGVEGILRPVTLQTPWARPSQAWWSPRSCPPPPRSPATAGIYALALAALLLMRSVPVTAAPAPGRGRPSLRHQPRRASATCSARAGCSPRSPSRPSPCC